MPSTHVIAGAHLAPVFLDAAATTAKAVDAIGEAATAGAELVAFPESFIPGFPVWAALSAPIHNHDLFRRFVAESITIDGPEVGLLRRAARRHGITVSVGISEKSHTSVGSIWNSNVVIGPDGSILNHHRKIVPTFYEKLIWTPGDGHGLTVTDTAVGRLGALICGENTNPLARYTLMAQAEQVHVSTYPPLWPTRDPAAGGKPYDLEAAIRVRAGAHSFEAKVFNLVVSAVFDDRVKDELATLGDDAARILGDDAARILDGTARGVSLVIDPFAEVISDVLRDEEGLLIQEIDLDQCVEPKQFHDVSGYYNRFDIFDLTVDRRRVAPIAFTEPRFGASAAAAYPDLDADLETAR
ncbi:carbon-nitrogen hydrolase family protein [Curtobacterium pusillum]|uniref:carbon-nitrogen hydrolase family protein n=1 Tax=Curtobacterium pusillum TaxID=69373 RepID=UPI0011A25BD0|nr:carbon-nitrogen hydrolase family protein [Curtobacterium pusillum]